MLTGVTFTGVDDDTDLNELLKVNAAYSNLEWGVLYGSTEGKSRFPSLRTRQQLALAPGLKCSLHFCGTPLRDLLVGKLPPPKVFAGFTRIQLNCGALFAGPPLELSMQWVSVVIDEIVVQVRDSRQWYEILQSESRLENITRILFDKSGGRGQLPEDWPKADGIWEYGGMLKAHGYAGGLTRENLGEQLPKIREAAGKADFWLDFETGVRTDDKFDLSKCVEIADFLGLER